MNNEVYTKEQLYSMGPQRTFNNDAREAAFLLGGIGTGNISVGARGELRDWEIFNSPGKGNYLPYTFFAIRAEKEGEKPVAKVLESEIQPPYSKSHGFLSGEMAGPVSYTHLDVYKRQVLALVNFARILIMGQASLWIAVTVSLSMVITVI